MGKRSRIQQVKDFLTFPIRSLTIFQKDKWGFSSLTTERLDYASREVIGFCLDVGCGKNNLFIKEFLRGNGKGIDIFPHEGLSEENLFEDLSRFPFEDASFDSVTFIGNINHIPKSQRDVELREAYRVLKPKGNIIVTMGNPFAEIIAHKLVRFYDKVFRTNYDWDCEKRGMREGEAYYLTDAEIIGRLGKAGFQRISKKHFTTQWGLNHLFVGWKT